ncbi:UNVERIFIED_CONTAM: hypothetical protein Sangu_2797100 [Sesamum angustifolium]|uniref:Zinc knuckle CX2CX4HX4C domain-containing protein n=1 Tax=Sesamum angustifolium TaxID=2727405 RepID=A0AAW2IT84_9LAMI
MEVDMDGAGQVWGSSMRLRVSIDVTKPLKRVLKLRTTLGDEQLLSFSYERLPNFCYLCGCLGHLSKFCELRFSDDFVDSGDAAPFGPWLRATNISTGRNRNLQGSSKQAAPKFSPFNRNPHSSSARQNTPCYSQRGTAIFGVFPSPATPSNTSPTPPNRPSPALPHDSPLILDQETRPNQLIHSIELPSYPNRI